MPSTSPAIVSLIEIASLCLPASITNKSLAETGMPGGDCVMVNSTLSEPVLIALVFPIEAVSR